MSFAIVINEKGGQPRRQEFLKGEITIGRVQGNDIVLPKQNVSKRHSRVVLKNGKFVITDLKSTNGTYVNGRKITTPMVIKETDKIYIGDFVLSTELIDGPSEGASNSGIAPPPPPPANSLPGARPPFPSGMPSKTIASGISPFAQQDSAAGPMTSIAPPPPMNMDMGGGPGSSPFGQPPAPPMQSPPPPSPPAGLVPPPSTQVAPSSPIPSNSVPSSTPNMPFGQVSQRATNESVIPVSEPKVSKPSVPNVAAPSHSPFGGVSQVKAPPPSQAAHSLSSSIPQPPSPASMDIDASVFDGQANNAPLVKIHQALNDGLNAKGLSTPTRYRPGQSLNPDLLDVAFEILRPFTQEHSEEVVSKVIDEAFSVGALQPLIEDKAVQELYLNGAHQLVYHQGDTVPSTISSPFSSVEQAQRAAMRILNGLGREGESSGEGRLGEFRVFVDLNGAEGPYVCMQRPLQQKKASQLGQVDAQVCDKLNTLLRNGGKIAIASRSGRVQAKMTSAMALESFSDHRVAIVGVNHHLGNHSTWITLEGSDDSLKSVEQLAPHRVIIQDQASLEGALVFEALSASSGGILMCTARDINAAIAKIRRRAGDDALAFEAVEIVLFVSETSDGQLSLSDAYSLTQGAHILSQGILNGELS
jgi:pilus assembly protein CpaF